MSFSRYEMTRGYPFRLHVWDYTFRLGSLRGGQPLLSLKFWFENIGQEDI